MILVKANTQMLLVGKEHTINEAIRGEEIK